MKTDIKHVVLLPNVTKKLDGVLLRNLITRILSAGCTLVAPEDTADFFAASYVDVPLAPDEMLFDGADLLIVLGGDGSIIDASRRTVGKDIPIVGINCGRLGYLAEIEIGELDLLDQVLSGTASLEERIMLEVEVLRGEETVRFATPALNDVTLTNGPVPRLLSFDLHCDGAPVEHCYADGMILSTPTGSTAYSMSAGGPILDPCMDCICATPICPQSMNHRPVIFGGESVLELHNMVSRGNQIYLSVDGREWTTLSDGDIVRVRHSRHKLTLIRVKNGGFLGALRRKLSDTL